MLSCRHQRFIKWLVYLSLTIFIVLNIMLYRFLSWPLSNSNHKLQAQLQTQLQQKNNQHHIVETAGDKRWLDLTRQTKKQLKLTLFDLVKRSDTRLMEFVFGDIKKEVSFRQQMTSISVAGQYAELLRFLVALANAHVVASLNRLTMTYHNHEHVLRIDMGAIVQ